jgi:hypothetical protein
LISPIIGRKGKDNLTIVIQTVTVLLGRVNIIVGKINGVICRAFKALSLQKI